MTKEQAKKRAEEWLSEKSEGRFNLRPEHATYKFGLEAYMQCYKDMTSGEPDGYGIIYDGEFRSDSVGEYRFASGYGNEVCLCFTDKTEAEEYIEDLHPTSANISIVPVKLLELEDKSKE